MSTPPSSVKSSCRRAIEARRASFGIGLLALAAGLVLAAPARADDNPFLPLPRFRFGLELGLGALADAGGDGAFAFGGQVRAGMQVDELFAFFVASRVTGGVGGVDGQVATLVVGGGILGMDFTIDDVVQFGVGAGVDGAGSSWCRPRAGPCFGSEGPSFGFEARVAYLLAPWAIGLRGGFPVALSWHATVVDGRGLTSSFLLTVGFELY